KTSPTSSRQRHGEAEKPASLFSPPRHGSCGVVQGAMMNVLVCVEPGKLEVVSRPAPAAQTGDALVRPLRIGICGTDYHIYEGKHPFLQYPRVMGHELAVEVVEAPADSPVKPGEVCVVNPYISCGTCIACRKGKPNCCVRIAVL